MSRASFFRMAALSVSLLALAACGGGGGGSGGSGSGGSGNNGGGGGGGGGGATSYTVGGSVSGLTGTGLVLQNNGGNNVSVAANGSFTFSTAVASGANYSVSVSTQPSGQMCAVSNGSGVIGTAAITNVSVSCRAQIARFVYVSNNGSNTVSVYSVDANTGALAAVGTPVPTGDAPLPVVVDPSEKYLYVATAGSPASAPGVSAYSINNTTGALTPLSGSPFPLSVSAPPSNGAAVLTSPVIDPATKFGFIADRSNNKLYGARIDSSTGNLTEIAGMPMSFGLALGFPVFDKTGQYLYVPYSEAGGGSTLTGYIAAFQVNATTGVLTPIGSPLPTGDTGSVVAQRDPSGKFLILSNGLLGTNVGHSLSVFSIDSSTGALTPVAGSPFDAGGPVQIVSFHPTKNFIFALKSDINSDGAIVIFEMDASTGVLTKTGAPDAALGLRPVIPGVEPTGKFLIVVNAGSNNIASFSVDQTNGALTQVAGSPLAIAQLSSPYRPDPSWKYLYSVSGQASSVSSYSLDATTGAVTLAGSAATGTGPGYVGLAGRQ